MQPHDMPSSLSFPLSNHSPWSNPAGSLDAQATKLSRYIIRYRLEEGLVNHQSPFCGSRTFGMCWATSQGLTSVGTTLHIDNHKVQPDGRMLVTAKGERRPGVPCCGCFTLRACISGCVWGSLVTFPSSASSETLQLEHGP